MTTVVDAESADIDHQPVLSHCPFCALNCGITLERSEQDKVVVGRWAESPLTAGAICVKGKFAGEQVDHRERLRAPLVRRGGQLVTATWEEALDEAARGFAAIAERQGNAANAVLGGGSLTNEKVYLLGKFARLVLRTPNIDYNGRFCMTSAAAAYKMAFGVDRMMTPLAHLEHAEVAVIVGANLSAAFPVKVPQLLSKLRRRGGRVVVVDPRRSRFVSADDLFVPIRPGSDGWFFGGVLRELAVRGRIDNDFIVDRTTGFADALAAVTELTPDRVAAECGIDASFVAEVAKAISATRAGMWLHGRGPEQHVGGVQHVLSIINAGLACGHVGRQGAGINMLTGQRNGQGGREWGQRCNQLPAGRDIDDGGDRRIVAAHWGVEADVLPGSGRTYVEILQAAGRGEIAGLFAMCTNMAVSAPDLKAVDQQLRSLEHLVVVDPFLTESAKHADVVLPGVTFAEEAGTITTLEGRVVRIDQALAPLAGRDDIAVLHGLAERLRSDIELGSSEPAQIFAEMCRVSEGGPVDYSHMSWDQLRESDGIFWGAEQLFVDRFGHSDGRAKFVPAPPVNPPVVADAEFPFVLTTGRVLSQFLSGSQSKRIAVLNERAPRPVVEIHPTTAAGLELDAGGCVELRTRQGTSLVAWVANPDLRPDTIFLPYHWPECNRLVAADLDPISFIPGFKYTPVALRNP